MATSTVIKRSGTLSETFSPAKLTQSIHAACLSVREPAGTATATAQAVCTAVSKWLENRPEVTSNDIRRVASTTLSTYSPEAAYFYQHHKHIL